MYHVCLSMLQRATTLAVVAVAAGIVLQPSQLSASILDKCCNEKNLDCMHYGRSNQVSPFEFSVRVNSGALLTFGRWTSAKNARSNGTLLQKGEGGFWLARCWTQLESNRFKCCFNSTHSVFLPPAVERWSSNSLFLSKPKPIYVRQWAVITKLLFSSQNQSPQRTAPPQPLSPATLSLSPRLSYFLFALLLASLSSFHLVFIIYCGAVLL